MPCRAAGVIGTQCSQVLSVYPAPAAKPLRQLQFCYSFFFPTKEHIPVGSTFTLLEEALEVKRVFHAEKLHGGCEPWEYSHHWQNWHLFCSSCRFDLHSWPLRQFHSIRYPALEHNKSRAATGGHISHPTGTAAICQFTQGTHGVPLL